MTAEVNKIDSNVTGLRIAAETTLGVLPGSPSWYDLEPNSYTDFGGNLTLLARNPISASRKRQKGVITDLDAAGGFNQDVTFSNLSALWPGLFLSGKKTKFVRENAASDTPITDVETTTDTVTFAADVSTVVRAGDLHYFSGFASNNGLKTVASVSSAVVTYSQNLTDEATVPAGAKIEHVGFQFAGDDADIARTPGSLPTLTSSAKDLTQLGLIPGEYIFIGGDTSGSSGNQFTNAHNNGFARVQAVAAGAITFDKTSGGANGETEMATETSGASVTIQIFFANNIIRDEDSDDALFARQTYTVERKLGKPRPVSASSEVQSEYIKGAVLNEFALNIGQADKVNADFTFIGTDFIQLDGASGNEPLSDTGSVIAVESATAYNTSSDFSRIKLAQVRPTQGGVANLAATDPLFAYVTEITLNITNNGAPNKAVGTLGAFDISVGTFELSGNITAYFADVAATQAVRNNADVTLDIALVKDFGTGTEARKAGILIDIPLIALGDGRLNVAQNEAITLPLQTDAAEYTPFGHTIILHEFNYLPNAADS